MSDDSKRKETFEKDKKIRLHFLEGYNFYYGGNGKNINKEKGYQLMKEAALEGNHNARWVLSWIDIGR